ncbi:unnamed protein product, partial [Phaeothamnion confervicola]
FGLTFWLRGIIGGNLSRMGNVYVVENDVLYTGDVAAFVRETEDLQGDMDFLTTKVHNATDTAANYFHANQSTWQVAPDELMWAEQFVYRLSLRLLLTLE